MSNLPTITGTKIISFERIKLGDQVEINDMCIFHDRLFVATNKGLYEFDKDRDVLRQVILQDN